VELRGSINNMTRHRVVFEIYTPGTVLRTSEVLGDFRIFLQQNNVYVGRGIIANLVSTNTMVVCEATLEDGWVDPEMFEHGSSGLRASFQRFFERWQKEYFILPEFKLLIADMHSFLNELRLWIEQVEIGVRSQPAGDRNQHEREALGHITEIALPPIRELFQRFESVCAKVDANLAPAHRAYVKTQLHPIVLCAPFMYRSFQKPLGYAGDYEMVNMMVRDPFEGGSLFAKVLNNYFLSAAPVVAHRNRITYLIERLVEETCRVRNFNRSLKVFNLGCGPAREVQILLDQHSAADGAEFTLVDFNDETLAYANTVLTEICAKRARRVALRPLKKSVTQLLRDAAMPSSKLTSQTYDVVYCAGLFDYLPDPICQKLTSIAYQITAPGGLTIITNVDPINPSRYWMEYSVDWHLLYRTGDKLASFRPNGVSDYRVESDATGVNVMLLLRKSIDG
jgi:extracellular factor (EF) 3-hydroxypalmitic acid methyl ester biosynthesis protein